MGGTQLLRRAFSASKEVAFEMIGYNSSLKEIYKIHIYSSEGNFTGAASLLVDTEKKVINVYLKAAGHHVSKVYTIVGDLNDREGAVVLLQGKKQVRLAEISQKTAHYVKPGDEHFIIASNMREDRNLLLEFTGKFSLGSGKIPSELTKGHRFQFAEKFKEITFSGQLITMLLLFLNYYSLSDLKNQIAKPTEIKIQDVYFGPLSQLSTYDDITITKSDDESGSQWYHVIETKGGQLLAYIELLGGPITKSSRFMNVFDSDRRYIFNVVGKTFKNCKIYCGQQQIMSNRFSRYHTMITDTEIDMYPETHVPYLKFYQNQVNALLAVAHGCKTDDESIRIRFQHNLIKPEPEEFAAFITTCMFYCSLGYMKKATSYLSQVCSLRGPRTASNSSILERYASILEGMSKNERKLIRKQGEYCLSANLDRPFKQRLPKRWSQPDNHSSQNSTPSSGSDILKPMLLHQQPTPITTLSSSSTSLPPNGSNEVDLLPTTESTYNYSASLTVLTEAAPPQYMYAENNILPRYPHQIQPFLPSDHYTNTAHNSNSYSPLQLQLSPFTQTQSSYPVQLPHSTNVLMAPGQHLDTSQFYHNYPFTNTGHFPSSPNPVVPQLSPFTQTQSSYLAQVPHSTNVLMVPGQHLDTSQFYHNYPFTNTGHFPGGPNPALPQLSQFTQSSYLAQVPHSTNELMAPGQHLDISQLNPNYPSTNIGNFSGDPVPALPQPSPYAPIESSLGFQLPQLGHDIMTPARQTQQQLPESETHQASQPVNFCSQQVAPSQPAQEQKPLLLALQSLNLD